jgi:DtxR family Mn-dependent transcriptional regulator
LLIAIALALVVLGVVIGTIGRERAARMAERLPGRRRRALLEDALKHVHDVEYRGLTASVESLGGALEVTGARAARIVAALEAEGLLERRGTALRLTDEGRSDARRILRIHRLWERWLAEETGVAETDWHALAEKREHRTSPEEAEELAARLGHPAWDPHGDPIPTAAGELPPRRGVPLPSLEAGAWGTIVHLEDEPAALYAELIEAQLHPGMTVGIEESSTDRVRFVADGRTCELRPVAAANVTVAPRAGDAPVLEDFRTLADLPPGERATVEGILPACLGAQRRRLLDLGLVPGTEVEAVLSSAAGDPTAYRIRGSLVALRREQSRWIRLAPAAGDGVAEEEAS